MSSPQSTTRTPREIIVSWRAAAVAYDRAVKALKLAAPGPQARAAQDAALHAGAALEMAEQALATLRAARPVNNWPDLEF